MIKFKFCAIIALISSLVSCSANAQQYGIDLSRHNTVSDWGKVQASFVYLKATEGTTIQDAKFHAFASQAKKHKIPVGAYHFMTTSSSIESQFENFKRTTSGYKMDLIPVLDIERQTKGYQVSASELRRRVRIFVNLCKKEYGKTPIIYCSQSFYTKYFLGYFTDCMYWCGDIKYPAVLPHAIHQTSIRQVPGIRGKVDYNVLNCKLKKIKL